ncbi:MmgE/PrpD family protein [Nocardia zapadnayensis]|uniref:MmgE/PrpD family protein n=1 Tax=Nocardia rhamnosiphila TaxID=426716 RepID=UPI002247D32A|nr:MmgE/PrpD family protein [Nocardia zapadnayensis]MCX0272708.1 MmgE/PrpD family protein [Nocardia zapadnayensis]
MTRALRADAGEQLWHAIRDTAESAEQETLLRAAGCLAVGLADMAASARDPIHHGPARVLGAAPGACTITGADEGAYFTGAATANSYLMHARLTDDSFMVAAHPGLTVIPVALAAAEHALHTGSGEVDGEHLLRAVIGGYECACLLAERLLPEVSRRGWRVTAAIAPLAAAATAALVLRLSDEVACSALGLASAGTGGPLGVVSIEGDGWRLQPALAVQAGVCAALAAAAGLRSAADALTAEHSFYALFGGVLGAEDRHPVQPPAIHRVTFKRYPVAMFGQSIFDAIRTLPPITGIADRIDVEVAPFAAQYGNQRNGSTTSIASVEGITLAAVQRFLPDLDIGSGPRRVPVRVSGDSVLPDLAARIELTLTDGRRFSVTGDGDTSGWQIGDFADHCRGLLGAEGTLLCDAAAALLEPTGIDRLLELWRATR